jgi:hypothetical protein
MARDMPEKELEKIRHIAVEEEHWRENFYENVGMMAELSAVKSYALVKERKDWYQAKAFEVKDPEQSDYPKQGSPTDVGMYGGYRGYGFECEWADLLQEVRKTFDSITKPTCEKLPLVELKVLVPADGVEKA